MDSHLMAAMERLSDGLLDGSNRIHSPATAMREQLRVVRSLPELPMRPRMKNVQTFANLGGDGRAE